MKMKMKTKKTNPKKAKNKGIERKKECNDKNCPFHGYLKLRGRTFTGVVIKDKMQKTVTISWDRYISIPKYERYAKKRTIIHAHNPACIKAKEGDRVRIRECRPLSKMKNFVVVENLGRERTYELEKEAKEEAKAKVKEEEKEEKTEAEKEEKIREEEKEKKEETNKKEGKKKLDEEKKKDEKKKGKEEEDSGKQEGKKE